MGDERATSAIDVSLGRRVRARRLEIGMSQERLADLLGVTFQQIQKYEKGVNRIAGSRLWGISKALDMPVAQFFEGDTEGSTEGFSAILATPEGVELMTLFASIKSRAVRRRVVHLVRVLADGETA